MELQDCNAIVAEELCKRRLYQVENARRKHNYIPLFLELLAGLARKGQLRRLLQQARDKAAQRASESSTKKAAA